MTLAKQQKVYIDTYIQTTTKKISKTRNSIFSIKEKVLFVLFALVVGFFAVDILQTQTEIIAVNKENITLQSKVDEQIMHNNELAVQVSQLSTSERIIAKANELGLTLNEKNVKVVQEK